MPQDKPKSVLKAVSSAVDSSRETPNSLIRRPQKVGVKMYVVSAAICKSFDWLGRAVARRPYSFIMTTLLFTVGCGVAFQMLFEQELDGEDLYTPASAQSFKDRDYVMETFGSPGQLVGLSAVSLILSKCMFNPMQAIGLSESDNLLEASLFNKCGGPQCYLIGSYIVACCNLHSSSCEFSLVYTHMQWICVSVCA